MVFILGASNIDRTLRNLDVNTRRRLRLDVLGVPSLSFNGNNSKPETTVQYQINNLPVSRREDIVIWHDVINNSLSAHKSNGNRPLTVQQLLNEIILIRHRIVAIVYVQRDGTPSVFRRLIAETGLLVLHIIDDIYSTQQRKRGLDLNLYQLVHPGFSVEWKTLSLVRWYSYNLRRLIARPQRPSNKTRKSLKNKVAIAENRKNRQASKLLEKKLKGNRA